MPSKFQSNALQLFSSFHWIRFLVVHMFFKEFLRHEILHEPHTNLACSLQCRGFSLPNIHNVRHFIPQNPTSLARDFFSSLWHMPWPPYSYHRHSVRFRFLHQQRSVCELEIKGSIFCGLWGPHGSNYQKLFHVLAPPRTATRFPYSLQRSQFLWTFCTFVLILRQDKFPDTPRVGLWVGFTRTRGFGKDVFTIVF